MKTNKYSVRNLLYIVISVATVLVCAFNSVGIAYARFNKSAMYSIICGKESKDDSTLTADCMVFDFGFWQTGNTENFAHTVVLESESALNGKLRFVWDDTTASNNDIIVVPDGSVSGTSGEYTVSEGDGRLDFPFSLVFSPTRRSGVAFFDVLWIPTGASEAAASARYLITLNPESMAAGNSGKISFVDSKTKFLTNDMLQISVTIPDNVQGAMFSVGSSLLNKFNAGTVYYTDNYSQGVKLLKDSILYLPKDSSGKINCLVNLYEHTSDSSINITAGITSTNYVTTSQTPTNDSSALSLKLSNDEPILSHTNPLKFVIKEPSALRDNAWNSSGSTKADVVWQIERFINGNYEDVEFSDDFTVVVSQTASGGNLTVSAPTGDQPAGTYRLTVTQNYNGYLTGHKTIIFYIDYR